MKRVRDIQSNQDENLTSDENETKKRELNERRQDSSSSSNTGSMMPTVQNVVQIPSNEDVEIQNGDNDNIFSIF